MEKNDQVPGNETLQDIQTDGQSRWKLFKAKCDNCLDGDMVGYSVFLKKNLCNRCAIKLEKQDRQQYPDKYLKYCGVPGFYRNCSLDNFQENKKLVDALREYVKKRPIDNLLLTGKCGCGKTHLAVAVLAEFIRMNIPLGVIYFISFENLLLDIRRSYDDNRLCDSEESIIQRFCEYDLLIIDDIGATQVKDFQIRILYTILEGRLVNNKKMILTTNLDPSLEVNDNGKLKQVNEIEQVFGARIGSRLAGFRIIKINMDDYRKKNDV